MDSTSPTILGELGATIVQQGGVLSLIVILLIGGAIMYRREIVDKMTTSPVSENMTAVLVAIQRNNDQQLETAKISQKNTQQSAEAFEKNLVFFEKLLVLVTELRDQAKANNDVLRQIRDVERERAEHERNERVERSIEERLRARGRE